MQPARAALARGGLALFDLDRTLLRGSSLTHLARGLVDAGVLRRRELLPHLLDALRFSRRGLSDEEVAGVRDQLLALVSGRERDPIIAVIAGLRERLAAAVYPGARLLVEQHLSAGDFCVIVSAAPQELVEVAAAELGVHRGVGTLAEVEGGRYTGALAAPFCYGPGKLERLRDEVGVADLSTAWAYADSGSDLPLLMACGRAVAVNPDRTLRAWARALGWPVLRLE